MTDQSKSRDDEEKPQNVLEELQSALVRRYNQTTTYAEPVVYEFTNDKGLLHQYFRLREIMYRKVFNTEKFVGDEDLHDKISYILIARRGRLCVGGARLTVREADEQFPLPMESEDFKLREAFPHLPLNKLRHAEISRFAVLDEDDDKLDIMLMLSKLIIEKCVDSGLGYAFLKSSLPMARNWRRIGQTHCNLPRMRICTEVKVPENPIHPEVKWYLTEIPLPASEKYETEANVARSSEALVH